MFKTKHRGLELFDSYLLGVFFYTIGCFFLLFKHYDQNSIFLYEISVTLFFCSSFLWCFSRCTRSNYLSASFFHQESKNKLFLFSSATLIFVVNTVFIYFVYVKIVQGNFLGSFVLLDIRKTISSGDAGYFYPGIIKQIRDIFAPAFMVWLILFYSGGHKKKMVFLTLFITLISMIFGGQRMPILALFLSIFLAHNLKNKFYFRKISRFNKFVYILFPLLTVFFLSNMLGRGEGEGFNAIFSFLFDIIYRVFSTVPSENYRLLPYLNGLNIPLFSLWVADLAILLPGTQVGISSDLHSYLGGSAQGNAVLGGPLDIYMNSGYLGLFYMPIITFIVLRSLQTILLHKKNPFAISLFFVLFCYMPFNYSLYLLLLNGGLMVILYGIYNAIIGRKSG